MTFSEELTTALEYAKNFAANNRHDTYSTAHLLKAILNRNFSLLKQLEASGVDVYFMEEWADVRLEDHPKSMSSEAIPIADDSLEAVLEEADEIRELFDNPEVDLFSIIVAIATPGVGFNFDQMKSFPITRAELLHGTSASENQSAIESQLANLPSERSNTKLIYKYCFPKKAEVQQNPPHVIGREKETKEIVEVLSRYSKPNVLLIGYPGVGKSAVINSFVEQIIDKRVPSRLAEAELFELDLSNLIAGVSFRGEIEDRLKKVLKELRFFNNPVLIIDGLHILLDKNSDNAGISSILKSEIEKGLTLVATTTIDEYTKKIEKDENLSGQFESINIEEPNDEDAFRMLNHAIQPFKLHHDVSISDDSLHEAIHLSRRYLKEKSLPESALNLLDRAMAVKNTSLLAFQKNKNSYLEEINQLINESDEQEDQRARWFYDDFLNSNQYLLQSIGIVPEGQKPDNKDAVIDEVSELIVQLTDNLEEKATTLTPTDLKAIIAQKTGIPVGKLQSAEKEKLQNMEGILGQRVVGQDQAIKIVSDAIVESRSGLQKKGQPIGSFFFLGPTGTGKTELAKSLADFMFQDENAIIRFDMSEFKEEHSAALLYGAPPGYVGYEEGGLLVNKIRQKPYSIVLFDEIEKAHTSVFDVFLQIMDEGKLHDRLGKEGDFSNALILFTSNIGSQYIVDQINQGGEHPSSNDLMEIMANHFRPEFLGRLTEIIPFGPITKENAIGIFEIHLKKELYDLLDKLSIQLTITDEAKEFLVDKGFNATYGARPLKGIIRSELRRPIARKLISEEIKENQRVELAVENNEIIWKIH